MHRMVKETLSIATWGLGHHSVHWELMRQLWHAGSLDSLSLNVKKIIFYFNKFLLLSLVVSVFDDGRYGGSISNVSQFQNFSCSTQRTEFSLTECALVDDCQSKCQYAIGIRCSSKFLF